MTSKLLLLATTKFLLGAILVGLLIFIPAGTVFFFNGWLLMAILFIPMFFAGIVMAFKNPNLLQERLKTKEKQQEQNVVIKLSGIMFLLGFILSGLGFRFNWYMLPTEVSICAGVVLILAYIMYAKVFCENTYLSRIIKVQENQRVVDTGLYSIVRHPMYTATLFLFLAMPIILGSLYAFLVFLAYPFIIAKRIKHEEKFLEINLKGYLEYKKKVKYRLIPFVW